jgi:hypothetical protein
VPEFWSLNHSIAPLFKTFLFLRMRVVLAAAAEKPWSMRSCVEDSFNNKKANLC